MHELPASGAVTPAENRVDEKTLDPHTLRVVGNTLRADAEHLRKHAADIMLTNAKRNRIVGGAAALEKTADYLESRALAVEVGDGRTS